MIVIVVYMLRLTLPGSLTIDDPGGFKFPGGSIGDIVAGLIPYVMVFASLVLLFMLIGGGFTLLTAAGNADNMQKGQKLIVSSLIGFLVVFAAFWIMELLQIILGVNLGFKNA